MRTRIRALLAATVLAGASGLVAIAPATADNHPTVVDVTSSIRSVPGTVSPPGTKVLFPVTFDNLGPAPVTGGTVTVTLQPGFTVVYSNSQTLTSSDCTGDNVTVTCSWSGLLLAGEKEEFEVVAHTPTAALGGLYVTKAVASATEQFEPLENRRNNHSAAETQVLPSNGEYSAGLVEGGHSLELSVADGRQFKLTVPSNIPGVIVEKLAPAQGGGRTCGDSLCGNGFILVFNEEHETYKAEDPSNPLQTERSFSKDPCNGLGAELKCHASIYFADHEDARSEDLQKMQNCTTSGQAVPAPCINRRYKAGGRIWFAVLMLTNDPLELPPALL